VFIINCQYYSFLHVPTFLSLHLFCPPSYQPVCICCWFQWNCNARFQIWDHHCSHLLRLHSCRIWSHVVWYQCFRRICCVYSLTEKRNFSFSSHYFITDLITQPRLHALACNVNPSSGRLRIESSLEDWNMFAFLVLWRSERPHILLHRFSWKMQHV
jgi:hypothetical protein